MSKRIDHLIKIYSEYKKIKGMADGGKVDYSDVGRRSKIMSDRDQQDKDLAQEISGNDENIKSLLYRAKDRNQSEAREMLGYSDGGNIKSDNDMYDKISDSFRKVTGAKPKVPPEETQEQRFERIRQDNTERSSGKRPSLESMDSDYNTQTMYSDGGLTGYSDGEDVKAEDDTPEGDLPEADLPKEGEEPEPYDSEEEPAAIRAERDIPDEESDDIIASTEPEFQQESPLSRLINSPKFSSQELAKAQNQRDLNLASAQIQRGAALMGGGIGHADPTLALKSIDETAKNADIPVKKFEEQVTNQKNDPTSDYSKAYASSVAEILGLDPSKTEGISGVTLDKIVPIGLKKQASEMAIQKTLLQQSGAFQRSQLGSETKSSIADANRDAANKRAQTRDAIERQKADAATKNAEGNKELKTQAGQDRALQQTKQMLESARGNPAAAQAEKDLYSVDKANSLFKLYPDLNKVPDAQVGLITQEIAKIAQGGVPTGHELEALKPNTPESRLQKLFGQVTNQPTSANLGAYLKELQKYTNALKGDAKKVIQDKYGRVIESSKKQLGDDNYKSLQDQYVNRFAKEDQNKHPQDQQAIEWAKNNMQDPRAGAILKANGIQ